jgi:hypothetical protein
MPRAKSDRIVTHRIELGVKEREIADSMLAAYAFNRVSTPIVAGMSDVSFMIVLGGLLTLYFPEIVLPTGEAKMEEVVAAIDKGIKEGVERAREERRQTGDSPLDEASGVRDLLGRLYYNLTNPNWSAGL